MHERTPTTNTHLKVQVLIEERDTQLGPRLSVESLCHKSPVTHAVPRALEPLGLSVIDSDVVSPAFCLEGFFPLSREVFCLLACVVLKSKVTLFKY